MVDLGDVAGKTFDAVIFDLDETLISSGAATRRAWTAWAIKYGVTAEQLAGCQGMPSRQVVEAIVAPELVDEAAEFVESLELNDYDDIAPLPGVVRAFEELPLERVAIATSCTGPLLDVRFRQSALPQPAVMVHRGMVKRGKPAPDPFLKAAELLGVDASRTLVVEDAPAGLAAATAAGAATLAVLTTTAREDLVADAVVANLDDIRWEATGDGVRVLPRR